MFGFLNVYKPKGKTSHDVIAVFRRITGVKQIGHTGTLDPFAEGVLPICIGKATRLIEYLDDDKAYIGTVQFGRATDTYDIEGKITKTSDKKIKRVDIENILADFEGEIEQKPPIYSAIKIKGKKLYDYAREGNSDVEIPIRKVFIKKLELINFNYENQCAELLIECSKGTYIRSIANDIGEILGVYGHLNKLIRIKAGIFNINNSIKMKNLNTYEDIKNNIIYPTKYLNYPKFEINNLEKIRISNGNTINVKSENGIIITMFKGNIVSIGTVSNGLYKPDKVFI